MTRSADRPPRTNLQKPRLIVSGILAGRFGQAESWAGLYHMTCSGAVSWCGFAQAIFARAQGLLEGKRPEVHPIRTVDYPTPAKRPQNSILSNEKLRGRFGISLSSWESALDEVVRRLTRSGRMPEALAIRRLPAGWRTAPAAWAAGQPRCTGQLVAMAATEHGSRKAETYSMQSPENWMEDFGSGTLHLDGVAIVKLDPAFAEMNLLMPTITFFKHRTESRRDCI